MNTDAIAKRIIEVHQRAVDDYMTRVRENPGMPKIEWMARAQEVQSILYNEIVQALELAANPAMAGPQPDPVVPVISRPVGRPPNPEFLEFKAGSHTSEKRTMQRSVLWEAWKRNGFQTLKAAKELGMHDGTFRTLADKFGLKAPRVREYSKEQLYETWANARFVTEHAAKALGLTSVRFRGLLKQHDLKKPWEQGEAVRPPEGIADDGT